VGSRFNVNPILLGVCHSQPAGTLACRSGFVERAGTRTVAERLDSSVALERTAPGARREHQVVSSFQTLVLRLSPEPEIEIGARAVQPAQAPISFDLRPKLLCGLCLTGGLLALRRQTVALLEAGAAAGVASFPEGRREVIARAISTDQLLGAGSATR